MLKRHACIMPFNDCSYERCSGFDAVIGVMRKLLDRILRCKFIFRDDCDVPIHKPVDSAVFTYLTSFGLHMVTCG